MKNHTYNQESSAKVSETASSNRDFHLDAIHIVKLIQKYLSIVRCIGIISMIKNGFVANEDCRFTENRFSSDFYLAR